MKKSDYNYPSDIGMNKNLQFGSFKGDTHITNKQWDIIKAIELSDYTPPFKGETKQEAAYYISKYKCFLPRENQ